MEVPLDVFGGRVTEESPTDVPEGCSPDEQDNTFIPGAVMSRPCLERVLTNVPAGTTCTYQKSFVTPTGQIKNLYLFSNGKLYWEDPVAAPGFGNLLYTGPVGSYAKSATMFGREFIALNDTLHGSTVPLQWDGTNLDRVTQDGPGAAAVVTSIAYPAYPLLSGGGSSGTVTSIGSTDFTPGPIGHPGHYSTFTVVLSAPATLVVNDLVTITGNTESTFNGTWTISAVLSTSSFKVTLFQPSPLTGTGGTFAVAGYSLQRAGNTVTAFLGTPGLFQVGYQVLISGVPANQVGGGIVSAVINNEDQPGILTITTATPHGLVPQNTVFLDAIPPNTPTVTAYAAIEPGVAQVTTAADHGSFRGVDHQHLPRCVRSLAHSYRYCKW